MRCLGESGCLRRSPCNTGQMLHNQGQQTSFLTETLCSGARRQSRLRPALHIHFWAEHPPSRKNLDVGQGPHTHTTSPRPRAMGGGGGGGALGSAAPSGGVAVRRRRRGARAAALALLRLGRVAPRGVAPGRVGALVVVPPAAAAAVAAAIVVVPGRAPAPVAAQQICQLSCSFCRIRALNP